MEGILSRHFRDVRETFDNVLASGDATVLEEYGREFKNLLSDVESKMSASAGWTRSPSLSLSVGARLRELTTRMIDPIQQHLASNPANSVLDVLDVECGFGHGTDLLASMYLTAALGYRLRVAACCTDRRRRFYLNSIFRTFVCVPKPFTAIRRKYDLVLSIFGVQRQSDGIRYCEALRGLAHQRVFLSAPYAEPFHALASGHLLVVDDAFLDHVNAENVQVLSTPAWGRGTDMKVVQFQLPGAASVRSEEGA